MLISVFYINLRMTTEESYICQVVRNQNGNTVCKKINKASLPEGLQRISCSTNASGQSAEHVHAREGVHGLTTRVHSSVLCAESAELMRSVMLRTMPQVRAHKLTDQRIMHFGGKITKLNLTPDLALQPHCDATCSLTVQYIGLVWIGSYCIMGSCISSSKHDTLPNAQASAVGVVDDDSARCLEDPMIAFLTCARPVDTAQSSGSPVMYALKDLACSEQPWSVVTGCALPYTREIAAALRAILSMLNPHKKALANAGIDTAHIQVLSVNLETWHNEATETLAVDTVVRQLANALIIYCQAACKQCASSSWAIFLEASATRDALKAIVSALEKCNTELGYEAASQANKQARTKGLQTDGILLQLAATQAQTTVPIVGLDFITQDILQLYPAHQGVAIVGD
eukprot:13483-Heterococcus_DN1.PRE.1